MHVFWGHSYVIQIDFFTVDFIQILEMFLRTRDNRVYVPITYIYTLLININLFTIFIIMNYLYIFV